MKCNGKKKKCESEHVWLHSICQKEQIVDGNL